VEAADATPTSSDKAVAAKLQLAEAQPPTAESRAAAASDPGAVPALEQPPQPGGALEGSRALEVSSAAGTNQQPDLVAQATPPSVHGASSQGVGLASQEQGSASQPEEGKQAGGAEQGQQQAEGGAERRARPVAALQVPSALLRARNVQ